MRRILEKVLLFLLRKVSGHAWKEEVIPASLHDKLEDQTVITVDAEGPGVIMKLYCPDNTFDEF